MRNLRLEINRFRLEDVLWEISNLSREVRNAKNENKFITNNAIRLTYSVPYHTQHYKKPGFYLTSWDLIDFAYYSIINVSDSFTKYPFDKNLFYNQLHYFLNKENKLSIPKQREDLLLYLYGFLGEQEKFQNDEKIVDNFMREQYLINKIFCDNEINQIIEAEIGVSFNKLCVGVYYLYVAVMKGSDLNSLQSILSSITSEEIRCVLNYYTADINTIRNSPYKRQQMYITPFIKVDNSTIIPINAFLAYKLFENSAFWAIRSHYNKQNKNDFIHKFTGAFEGYVNELFYEYLDPSQYEKIPTVTKAGERRADFRVQFDNYSFLFEVKGALATLDVKQQNTDIKSIRKFIDRTLVEAVKQLKRTEEILSPEKFFKVVLIYEDYFKSEIMDVVLESLDLIDEGTYWLMTIDELEKLLHLYKNNFDKFKVVIEEKIEIEKLHSLDGRDFNQVFIRNEINENSHLKKDTFYKYYKKFDDDITNFS